MPVAMQRLILIGVALVAAMTRPGRAGEAGVVERNGVVFRTYRCEPGEVRVFWRDEAGGQYGNFARLEKAIREGGQRLVFAMNGGIFEPDGVPTGLHVEEGRVMNPLNLKDGKGNFFLKPNGVFFVDSDGAHVVEASEFEGRQARVAVQSGPLLLRDGRMHPAFSSQSKSRLHRNGVGILKDGSVFFAITDLDSNSRVTLHDFAVLFRSEGCRDALFLDGDISLMWTPDDGTPSPINNFGAILGVVESSQP